ncbi:condensation domain-containing protein [Corynebacterium suicordis]
MSPEPLMLTGAQVGIWNAQQLSPESPFYVVGEVLEIGPGEIVLSSLVEAVEDLQREHDTLRARFFETPEGPRQMVAEGVSFSGERVRVVDLRGSADPVLTAEAWADSLRGEFAETARHMVDRPLCSYTILRLRDDLTWVVQLYHHIIIDGFSAATLTRRLGQIYTSKVTEKKLRKNRAGSLVDLVDADRDYLASEDHQADQDFWTRELSSLPEVTERAAMNTATGTGSGGATTITTTMRLSSDDRSVLDAAAEAAGVNWVEFLIGTYTAFVHRLTSVDADSEQFLALPVMARTSAMELRTPAMAVNVLPLRVRVSNEDAVQEVIARTAAKMSAIREHQRLRGETLPRLLDDPRVGSLLHGAGVNAKAFDTTVKFADTPAHLRNIAGGPPEDLGLVVTPAPEGQLDIAFETDPHRVSREHAQSRLESFRTFLRSVAEQPQRTVGELPLLTVQQRSQVIEQRASEQAEPADTDLARAFEALQERTDTCVVFHEDDTTALTGSELYAEVTEHAAELTRVFGQRSEAGDSQALIALDLPRGRELVVLLLAALYAQVPFVYVDPSAPASRRKAILDDATPTWVARAGDQDLLTQLRAMDTAPEQGESSNVGLSYLMYTSGSTGTPKGVEVPWTALDALFRQHVAGLYARPRAVVGHTASFGFDASLDQLLWLLAGHEVHVYPANATGDADALVAQLREDEISVFDATPSLITALFTARLVEHVPTLRLLVIGGEALPQRLWNALVEAPELNAVNVYGPTEATVDALIAPVTAGAPHIGRPVAGMSAYLVDSAMQLVPNGEAGELLLAGPQLARGYRNLSEETAKAFVEVSVGGAEPERMYRTGDRARWVLGRGYEFLGRADGQLEINGQRVETGEIEAALMRLDSVRDAVVVAAPGERGLWAAVVAEGEGVDTARLRSALSEHVVAASIPQVIVEIPRVPMNTSGKVDRAEVRRLVQEAQATEHKESVETSEEGAPVAEQILVREVAKVLDVAAETVDAGSDLISLGGDSISALSIASAVRQAGVRVLPKDLLAGRALRTIAANAPVDDSVDATDLNADSAPGDSAADIAQNDLLNWGFVPFSPVVRAQLAASPTETAFREHAMYRRIALPSGFKSNLPAVNRAVRTLMARHDSLRMIVDRDHQRFLVPRVPLSDAEDIVSQVSADTEPQDLAAQLRPDEAIVWQVGVTDHDLLVVVHHVAIDALSWNILADEMQLLLSGVPESHLPAVAGSMREHWLQADQTASEQNAALQIQKCTRGEAVAKKKTIDGPDTAALTDDMARRFHARRGDVAVAMVARALAETARSQHQLVIEGHGRGGEESDVDLSRTLGWFTTETRVNAVVERDADGRWDAGASIVTARRVEEVSADQDTKNTIVLNVLDATAEQDFGVWESDERLLTEALTVNMFVGDAASGAVEIEYTSDPSVWTADGVQAFHDALMQSAQDVVVADALGMHRTLPEDHQDVALDSEQLRDLEAQYGALEQVSVASPVQQGMLYHSITEGAQDRYVIAAGVRLSNPGSPETVRQALLSVMHRHGALRAVFTTDAGDQPLMLIPENTALPWQVHDCRELSAAAAEQLAERLRVQRGARRIDLTRGPLMSADLVLLPADDQAILVLGNHHIVTDGWSTNVMLREVEAALNGDLPTQPAPRFAEYLSTIEQRDSSQSRDMWTQMMTPAPRPSLVAELGSEDSHTQSNKEQVTTLFEDSDGALQRAAQSVSATPSALVQTAWALTLAALTGRPDVTFGVTVSGRPVDMPQMAAVVGLFINTVPLRFSFDANLSLSACVQAISERMSEIGEHDDTPLSEVERIAGVSPLFDSVVVYDHYAMGGAGDSADDAEAGEKEARIVDVQAEGQTHFPMTLVCPPGENLQVQLAHRPELVDAQIASAAADIARGMVEQLASSVDAEDVNVQELVDQVSEPWKDVLGGSRGDEQAEKTMVEQGEKDETGSVGVENEDDNDPTVQKILTVMEDLLGREGIGAEQNFFDIGGDSLLAMRMMGKLRKQGIKVPIQDIVETGTAVGIAQRAGGSAAPKLASKPEHKPTLWCVHPVGGFALPFAALSEALKEVATVEGIELPDPLPKVTTVAELADLYLKQITSAQSEGPYLLAGYSFGGAVAENIAATLQARGQKVQFLGILDAYPSGQAPLQNGSQESGAVHALTQQERESSDADSDLLQRNIEFCMGLARTAKLTDYAGTVQLVTATEQADHSALPEDVREVLDGWDPASSWKEKNVQLEAKEIAATHAALLNSENAQTIAQWWTPHLRPTATTEGASYGT